VKLKWQHEGISFIKSSEAKIILNFVILGLSSMIYGGEIEIFYQAGEFNIKFMGSNLILVDATQCLLLGKLDNIEITSTNIQIYYTQMLISQAERKLIIQYSTNEAEFSFK